MTNRSPSIWISEIGSMRQQRDTGNMLRIDNSDEVQTSIMRKLVTEIPEESERIKRFYYYHWSADSSSFDSALLYRGSCSGCAEAGMGCISGAAQVLRAP